MKGHEFPEYTDAAGVKWTADFWIDGKTVTLVARNVPAGELAYSYIMEDFARFRDELPPAADRDSILDSIKRDVRDWKRSVTEGRDPGGEA